MGMPATMFSPRDRRCLGQLTVLQSFVACLKQQPLLRIQSLLMSVESYWGVGSETYTDFSARHIEEWRIKQSQILFEKVPSANIGLVKRSTQFNLKFKRNSPFRS